MKKTLFFVLTTALITFTLINCSTTKAGSVGADRNQIMIVSEEEMIASAKQAYTETLEEAKKSGTLNKNAATTNRVKNVANKLIAQVGAFRDDASSWEWEVNVITDETVNAWCMAGGKIVVYTGIIDALDLTDAQLAAVMGHEISHALKEHSREQASSSALTNMGISVVSEKLGLGTIGQTGLSALAQYTLTLPFSRSHETEADNMGTELMARAGYDPNEAVKVWEKMSQLGSASVPEIMSTHPSNESRIENLKGVAKKVYPLYQSAKK